MLINEIVDFVKTTLSQIEEINGDIVVADENHNDGTTTTWLAVEVKSPSRILGKDGEGLSALNHVIHRIIESKNNQPTETTKHSYILDINGFQKKKIESLHALAHMMAERARYFKSNIEMNPMTAFERKVIHDFLSNENDLKTESEGVGKDRKVIIKYIGSI